MFGSFILDVAIGMVFIYLLLSLVASGVNEILASIVQSRAANLVRGLRSLLSGDSIEAGALTLVDNIYDHGLVRGLYPDPLKDLNDDSALGWVSQAAPVAAEARGHRSIRKADLPELRTSFCCRRISRRRPLRWR